MAFVATLVANPSNPVLTPALAEKAADAVKASGLYWLADGIACDMALRDGSDLAAVESAIRAVMQIRSWNHRAASNRAVVQETDGKYSVVCSIGDMGSDVFRLELAMPDKLTAEMIKNNFIAHGSDIYPKLMDTLTQPGSEDDRPPAALQ